MLFAALFGALIGIVAGLIPGLHTNLLAVLIGGLGFPVLDSAVFLSAMAVSRSVVDAIPTSFLGFSDDVLALSPSARLLKKGEGVLSARLLIAGALIGGFLCVLLIPLLIFVLPFLFSLIGNFLFWILLALVVFLLFRKNWFLSFVFFSLAGVLGLVALNSLREPLFPLLSGLFGASLLFSSLFSVSKVPFQKLEVTVKNSWFSCFGVVAACFVTLFPGLSPSQAASLISVKSEKKFLLILGALGTADVVVSLVTFFALGKTRNGAVVIIDRLVDVISFDLFLALIASSLLALGLSCLAAWWLSRKFVFIANHCDSKVLASVVLSGLLVVSFILSGWKGVLVLICGASLGILTQKLGVTKSHLMGCLLVPTLFNLFPF
jgi:putative membrane protein